MPQIEVTFDIDANGILHVGAKDKATGKENKIKIQASSGLTEAEIQRMVKDAEAHAEDDRKTLELVNARNQTEALVHSVRKSLKDYGDKLDAGEKEKIEASIKDAESVLKSENKAEIDAKAQALGAGGAEARREDVRRRAGQGPGRASAARRASAGRAAEKRRKRGGRRVHRGKGQEDRLIAWRSATTTRSWASTGTPTDPTPTSRGRIASSP